MKHILRTLALLLVPTAAHAALPIDLEIATQAGAPITAQQQWARLLGRMDLGSVRLRGIRGGDRPAIESRSTGTAPRWRVVAILNPRNELVFPQRRFGSGDTQALKKYLQQLPADAAYNAEERGRFGLTEKQFRQVYAELSQPVGFATVALSASDIVRRLDRTLSVPLAGATRRELRSVKPLGVELSAFSAGTGLAIALRSVGLALHPEQLPGEPLRLVIAPLDDDRDAWPVGWKPAVSARKSAPQLFKSRNIELSGFTLSQALTALAPALQLPVVFDERVLEQQRIDPTKVQVSLPKKKTFLKSALGGIASQARLAADVRVDEAEQPFVWLTQHGRAAR